MSKGFLALCIAGLVLVVLAGRLNLWLGLAAALGLAWFFWYRAGRFLAGLKKFAEDLSKQDFGARVSPQESGSLAGAQMALESMAFDLGLAFERQALDRGQLETALAGIEDGVLLLDSDGHLLYANPSLEGFFRSRLPERKGAFYWELFREAELVQGLRSALEGAGAVAREIAVPYPGGERILLMSASSLRNRDVLALFHDRSDQKKLEKMRSEFAANVSHELRTPLTAIKAALETLKDGALDDPKVNRNFLDKALSHSERLQELISDLLALAAVEEDRRLIRVDRGSRSGLRMALNEAEAGLEEALRRSQGSVQDQLPEGLPDLCIQRSHLRQVLINLMENALKYAGPHPVVTVSAQEAADHAQVEVAVSDRGAGIPVEDLPRVFERFYRVDKARAREGREGQGGSGLGLAIVKHLIENYGGSVGVENLAEGGCRFWFKLPSAKP
ncbi:MAG: ATP-binding protein [candidate division FCPU426 bacterium]